MEKDANLVTLWQGDLYFGESPGIIATLLGSCVAVTLWHPHKHIGGMCHVVVPQVIDKNYNNRCSSGSEEKIKQESISNVTPSGHSGSGLFRNPISAAGKFMEYIVRHGTQPSEYEVGMYGGGNMFPGIYDVSDNQVGRRNIEKMQEIMHASGFILSEFHVGGNTFRKVTLNLGSGEVIVSGHDVRGVDEYVVGNSA